MKKLTVWKRLAALMMVLIMVFALAACSSSSSSDEETSASDDASEETAEDTASDEYTGASGEISIGSTAQQFLGHFDVSQYFSTESSTAAKNLVYDAIFSMGADGEWYSEILEEYYWSDEVENLLVLTLKDGIYFASGDQMTASDMLWSLQRFSQSTKGATNFTVVDFDSSYVSDDGLTLYLQYTEEYAPWKSGLSQCVMNQSFVEALEAEGDVDWYDPASVDGSGPYEITESVTDISITFEKRDDWWQEDEYNGEAASIQTITVYSYSDNTTMMADYLGGVIDVAINLTAAECDEIGADETLGTYVTVSANSVDQIVLSVENESLQNETLRQAICIGVDADAIEEVARGSLGSSADSTLASTQPYYVGGHSYEYDPELAAELVIESGVTDLEFDFVINQDSISESIAEQFQYYMEQIGITVNILEYDQSTAVSDYWSVSGGTDFQINGAAIATASNEAADATTFYRASFSYPATAQTDETIVQLLEDGRTTVDEEERAEIYAAVQDWFYENYSIIPIGEWSTAYAYSTNVESCVISITGDPVLRFIKLAD